MMASMAQPFPHPGAMAGHGGMPPGGHPIAPGHPSNPGMAGGQPGVMAQQMHAMGGPQVTQGPMMNLSQGGPGMGAPNSHAMSHLAPNIMQQQLQQQQIQHAMANNPQLLQQQRAMQQQQQQRMLMLQQQQQQQQQMQGQGQGHMGMSPQQIVMMNQMQMRNLPPHIQAMQQAQSHPGQFMPQGQQTPQQSNPQQQIQQLAAIQAAQAAAANQAGSAPNQPTPQQPMRPPSTIGGAPEPQNPAAVAAQQQAAQQQAQQHQAQQAQQAQQQHVQQQQQQQQPNQGQQQGPQTQVSQQPPNQPPPAQAPPQSQGTPQPPANPQQPAQPQAPQQPQAQGQQQQPPPQQGQQQQQNPQQADPAMQAKRQQLQQQLNLQQQAQVQAARNQAQAMAFAGMQQNTMNKHVQLLKLYQFGESLSPSSLPSQAQPIANDIVYWRSFVSKFFSETGVFRQRLWNSRGQGDKEFELATPIIARFFWTHYNSGVKKIQMIMESPSEKELPNGACFFESPRTSFIYWFSNGHQIVASGSLRAHVNSNCKFDFLEHQVSEYTEHVPLKSLQPESPEQKPSPNVTKGGKKAAAQQRINKPSVIPKSAVNDWGVGGKVFQLLETGGVFSHMSALFDYARSNPSLPPHKALRQLVMSWSNGGQNPMIDGAGQFNPALPQQASQGTPGPNYNGPPQFASPAPGAHLNLPNTASPASMNMSPAMQAHGLQNAAGSQGPSANASPNVSNKRRRASGVKIEGDGDNAAPEPNGPKVKQSPRVGKRQKPGA